MKFMTAWKSIQIPEELYDKLQSLKTVKRETNGDVIEKLIKTYEENKKKEEKK